MKLINLTTKNAVFIDNDKIISLPINLDAKKVLEWHRKNVPANR